MTSTGEVYFWLYGENFEPNEISDFIGLTATRMRRRDERNPDLPLPKNSAWKFSLGKIEDDVIDVYEMSENLVLKLTAFESKIAEAIQKFNLTAVLQLVLWIDQDETKSMPAIGFERPVLDFVNAVGATIDVDTFRN